MEKPKSSGIAKWGAACSACAGAKAKCLRSNETPGARCDRCERLDKECAEQVHRPRKKRQSKPSKTAQLEARLNSLVDLLKATGSADAPAILRKPSDGTTPSPYLQSDGTPSPSSQRERSLPGSGIPDTTPSSIGDLPETVPATYNLNAPPQCICRAPTGAPLLAVEPDDVLLSLYMEKLCEGYPFVIIPPGTTAAQLATTKPFLLQCIKMAASIRNLRSMRAQAYAVTKVLSERILLESDKSIELLQGLLIFVGWHHYHCIMHSQLNNLLSLANSMIADLAINRPPELHERTRMLVLNPGTPKARTNDERRALCGVWYMTSTIALVFNRLQTPRYTHYIDKCVRELEEAREYESDILLVQLIRIQRLSERIQELREISQPDEQTQISRAPLHAYLGTFQAELDRFKAQVPESLRSHVILNLHINSANLRLWETPKIDASLESMASSLTSLSLGPSTVDLFYRSHNAIRTWFDYWLSIDIADYFYLTLVGSAHVISAVTMLFRWAKLSTAGPRMTQPERESVLHYATQAHGSSVHHANRNTPFAARFTEPDANTIKNLDGNLPAAVATIKERILSQPDLHIDVVGTLGDLMRRFEDARGRVGTMRGVRWENNIWDLSAKKIGIMRLKLERWADIVATIGVEGVLQRGLEPHEYKDLGLNPPVDEPESTLEVHEDSDADGEGEEVSPDDATSAPMEGVEGQSLVPEDFEFGNAWAENLFDGLGLDQYFMFEGTGDYGTQVMNSL